MKTVITEQADRQCPVCGAPLAADAPQGLCGACLLAGAAVPTAHAATTSSIPQDVPSLERVAAAFPQFEIIELIGAGGMGAVYKARQPKLDRLVALKVLSDTLSASPAFAERFNREALVLARLNHPNIVTVFDYGQSGGFFYLLMEYVDGVNLRQAMKAGRFTPQQALALVPKVCDALQFAHDEGILHRDIKPENLLLDTRGRVKIADFGIAKLMGEPRPVTKLTATGAAIGTPNYMAPEQIEHPEDVDQRADIYSLGVVFYEMLTGELPIGRFAPPSRKTDIDERVDEIVLRALARERELRQRSAHEVKTQVERIPGPKAEGRATEGPAFRAEAAESPPSCDHTLAAGSVVPAGDFILLNPRLPRMARAITVYALLMAPVLWLAAVLLTPPEVGAVRVEAYAVQQCTLFVTGWGRFLGVVLLLVGGFKLRGLRRDALRWVRQGIWLHLSMLAVRGVGLTWADALNRMAATPTLTPWMIASAILGLGTLAWEIASLVWLHRHAPVLHPLLGLPAPRDTARHATAAALWTGLSVAMAAVVTGVFLAAPQVAAWQWGEPFPLYRLGSPGSPGGLLIYCGVLCGVVVCAVNGMRRAWQALREIRSAQGRIDGVKRAVFAVAAWPMLLAMGGATIAGTVALVQLSRGGLATVAVSVLISLVIGEVILGRTWRWAMGGASGDKPGRMPGWVHRWVVGGQLLAIAVFVPIIAIAWPQVGQWPEPKLPSDDSLAANGSVGAGEAYMDGLWTCDDLVALVRLLVRNRDRLDAMETGLARLGGWAMRVLHAFKRNTRSG
ncbi:MAG TPA: protein kinase, partial [Verrucomicrobiota bacterium]|nr:protein kinase [Verrucomicrobiota bacterium]